jgi:hypothetical protein
VLVGFGGDQDDSDDSGPFEGHTRLAAARGVPPEAYAATLHEEAVHTGTSKRLTTDQLDHTLRELAQFSAKIPVLADEAFTREGLYQDHD